MIIHNMIYHYILKLEELIMTREEYQNIKAMSKWPLSKLIDFLNDKDNLETTEKFIALEPNFICLIKNENFTSELIRNSLKISTDGIWTFAKELPNIKDEETYNEIATIMASESGDSLVFIDNQTDNICLTAVKQNGLSLQYVKNKTEEICTQAIINAPYAIRYVPSTEPFYKSLAELAVRLDGNMFQYINSKQQTKSMVENAIKCNAYNINYVNEEFLSPDIIMKAVRKEPYLISKFDPDDIETGVYYNTAVKEEGTALSQIPKDKITLSLCLSAVLEGSNIIGVFSCIPDEYIDIVLDKLNEYVQKRRHDAEDKIETK